MRWFTLSLVALGGLSVAAFVVQNSSRTAELSFDTGFSAWKLTEPVSLPLLMALCFLGGALLTWAFGLRRSVSLGRRVRQLEQELALRAPTARDEAPGGGGKGGWE